MPWLGYMFQVKLSSILDFMKRVNSEIKRIPLIYTVSSFAARISFGETAEKKVIWWITMHVLKEMDFYAVGNVSGQN